MNIYTDKTHRIIAPINFKPTKLMVRMIVRDNGEKIYYLHKTSNCNPNYQGSGTVWKKYLQKYESVLIWESEYYVDCKQLQNDAIQLSLEHDIINSPLWANCVIENGLDGALPGNTPWNKNKPWSEGVKYKMRKPKSNTDNMGRYERKLSTIDKLRKARTKYIYVIEGIEYYDGETETAKVLGLNLNTFKDRIRTKSKTFKDWYKKPI
jgi:hypothetical protein